MSVPRSCTATMPNCHSPASKIGCPVHKPDIQYRTLRNGCSMACVARCVATRVFTLAIKVNSTYRPTASYSMRRERTGRAEVPCSHAVVIGAGVVGLMTAKVLSKHYDRVTLCEKQQLHVPEERPGVMTDAQLLQENQERTGAAQNSLTNIFILKAAMIAEQYFPGLADDFLQAGAFQAHWKHDMLNYMDQTPLPFSELPDVHGTLQSKTLTETMLRYRLMSDCPNVEFVSGKAVARFLFDEDRENVTGVVFSDGSTISADFVAHTGGRTCNPSSLLAPAGYPAVPEEVVDAKLKYLGVVFRNADNVTAEGLVPARMSVCFFYQSPTSREFHTCIACQQDNSRVTTFIVSRADQEQPKGIDEYLSKFRQSPVPGLYDYLKGCTPVSPEVMAFRTPNRWRRFDKMQKLPGRLVFLGDVSCANSPAMGQGMECGLQCVATLDELLKDTQGRPKNSRWVHTYHKQAAAIQRTVWVTSSWLDLQYPDATKTIGLDTRVSVWYFTLLSLFIKESGDPKLTAGYLASWTGLVPFADFALNPAVVAMTLMSALQRRLTASPGDTKQPVASSPATHAVPDRPV